MGKIYVLVEGQTEEKFVKEVLCDHLASCGIFLVPVIAQTKRESSGLKHKGGNNYQQIKNDLRRLLNDPSVVLVTTLLDLYGLRNDFPGKNTLPSDNCYLKLDHLEQAFKHDLAHHKNHLRFYPFLVLHEFEAFLFSAPHYIADHFLLSQDKEDTTRQTLQGIRDQYKSPEEINDSPETAPSKRLSKIYPRYRKKTDGVAIIQKIGLETIRAECPHFNEWLTKLESVGHAPT